MMSEKINFVLFTLLALLLCVTPVWAQQSVGPGSLEIDAEAEFNPARFSPAFKPVINAPVIAASEVTNQVAGDELVLGVVSGGQSRAYPLNVLTGPAHEIINDTLGGRPIAATWCPLCYNGVVYARRLEGRTLTFGVSGLLWNQSMVMYDAETNSYWSPWTGRAMQGPLKGTRLEALPGELTTWDAWRSAHPETTVLNLPRTERKFTRELYENPERFVYGWSIGLQRYHCPLYILQLRPVMNLKLGQSLLLLTYDTESTEPHLFSSSVDGRALNFTAEGERRMRDEQSGSTWNPRTGEALAGPLKGKRLERRLGIISYREAWLTFYPKSKRVPVEE